MPLYVGDYLRDTGHLSPCEHGIYLLLLMQAWTRGGALPADEARLRKLAGADEEEWAAAREEVLAFFILDGNEYRSKRLDAELERRGDIAARRRAAGSAGATARWQRDGKPDGKRDGKRMANAMAKASQTAWQNDGMPQPQSKTISLPSEARSLGQEKAAVEKELAARFERWYGAYPRKDGRIAAEKAYRRALRRATADELDAGLARYRFSDDPKYIPLPATWLNQGRWDSSGVPADAPRRAAAPQQSKLGWVLDEVRGSPPDDRPVLDGDLA